MEEDVGNTFCLLDEEIDRKELDVIFCTGHKRFFFLLSFDQLFLEGEDCMVCIKRSHTWLAMMSMQKRI